MNSDQDNTKGHADDSTGKRCPFKQCEMDTPSKLSKPTIVFHWLVAAMMITLLSVGIFMAETKSYGLYPIHKSFGMLILLLVLPRIVWRAMNGWPTAIGNIPAIQLTLAKTVHWVLLLGTLMMPLSGMLMSGLGGHGLSIFGLELLAANYDPVTQKAIPINGSIASFAHTTHHWTGYILVASLVLHVAGALKHHFLDKDGTLRRMVGKDLNNATRPNS